MINQSLILVSFCISLWGLFSWSYSFFRLTMILCNTQLKVQSFWMLLPLCHPKTVIYPVLCSSSVVHSRSNLLQQHLQNKAQVPGYDAQTKSQNQSLGMLLPWPLWLKGACDSVLTLYRLRIMSQNRKLESKYCIYLSLIQGSSFRSDEKILNQNTVFFQYINLMDLAYLFYSLVNKAKKNMFVLILHAV